MSTRAWESTVLDVPIGQVWQVIRNLDFAWCPNVTGVEMKNDGELDEVGSVRVVTYSDQTKQTLRLAELSDARHVVSWECIESVPAPKFSTQIHTIRLRRVTKTDSTFVEWETDFSRDADANTIADARYKCRDNFQLLREALNRARLEEYVMKGVAKEQKVVNPPLKRGQVSIAVSCSNLIKMDLLSKSDPCVVVFDNGRVLKTEVIKDSHDPEFKTHIVLDYFFFPQMVAKFEIYDVDGSRVFAIDFMGSAIVPIADLLDGKKHVFDVKNEQNKKHEAGLRKEGSTITLQIIEQKPLKDEKKD